MPSLPNSKWLLSVYVKNVHQHIEVHQRIEEIKAKVTSTYGDVLKLDDKKVTKKFARIARGTAAWAINVGNEAKRLFQC